jgi:hypothetical protein
MGVGGVLLHPLPPFPLLPPFFQLITVVIHKDDFALVFRSKKRRLLYMFSFHAWIGTGTFRMTPSTYSLSLALNFTIF